MEDPFEVQQPTLDELLTTATQLMNEPWRDVLPGLARLSLETEGTGATYSLRIVKTAPEAAPVTIVRPDDPGSEDAGALLQVDTLQRYPFLVSELAEHAGINPYLAQAIVYLLGLKDDTTFFRRVPRGKKSKPTYEDRYSHAALREVRRAVDEDRVIEAHDAYRQRHKST